MTIAAEHSVDALLSELCELFDDELERQTNVLAACRAQGDAARLQDTEEMERRTRALTLLLEEAMQAERRRIQILKQLVGDLGLPAERQTLTDLISATPEPWRARMQEFQIAIRRVLAQTQEAVHTNARRMKHSLRVVGGALRTVTIEEASGADYDAEGRRPVFGARHTAMLDALG
ncbi:MAG: flagellar export chaperone FlgN [Candidatus Hydrogenedentota bacterium]